MTRNAENALSSWRSSSLVEENPALDGLMIRALKDNLRYLRAADAGNADTALARYTQRNEALTCFEMAAEQTGHQGEVLSLMEKTFAIANGSPQARADRAKGQKEMQAIPAREYDSIVLKTPEPHCPAETISRNSTARQGSPPWSQPGSAPQRSGN